ncbi:MAG: plasmid stabilization protein [Candidatus Aminicenantes bacterium]|nr:plasmid stabilization protein [Candidatus Aminicenantes bacterium]
MNYKIIYTESYNKRAAKFIRKHPELIKQYEKTLKLLELNPFHPTLHLHKLSGKLNEIHAVYINISYRITMEFIFSEKTVIPVNVGTHDEIYV